MDLTELRALAGINIGKERVKRIKNHIRENFPVAVQGAEEEEARHMPPSSVGASAFPQGIDPDDLSEAELRQLVQSLTPEEMVQFMKALIARSKESLGFQQ